MFKKRGYCAKYWETIADNLKKAGWSWGCVSAIDANGRTIWIADAHRDNGKRFPVRADEKLTVPLEAGGLWPNSTWLKLGREAGFARATELFCDPTGFYRYDA